MNNINDFGVGGNNPKGTPNANTFESMYEHSVDPCCTARDKKPSTQ